MLSLHGFLKLLQNKRGKKKKERETANKQAEKKKKLFLTCIIAFQPNWYKIGMAGYELPNQSTYGWGWIVLLSPINKHIFFYQQNSVYYLPQKKKKHYSLYIRWSIYDLSDYTIRQHSEKDINQPSKQ